METNHRKSEQGQALILLVLAAIVLLGFTALAVDGGMVYSDRRQSQTAADAASLAGAGAAALYLDKNHFNYENWSCSGPLMSTALSKAERAALERAGDNDAVNDPGRSNLQGVIARAECKNDSFRERWFGKYIDVTAIVSNTTPTSFAHFVFHGLLQNTVTAVARYRPRGPLGAGYAIVGLNQEDCDGNQNGVTLGGTNDINIYVNAVDGGGVFSNGCMSGDGTTFSLNVTNGDVNYVDDLDGTVDNIHPSPTQLDSHMPEGAYDVPPPDCSKVEYYGSPSNAYKSNARGTIPPGNYSGINLNGEAWLVGGGLYCMYGDFDTGNADLSIDTSNGKQGVTIYLISGSFTTGGNGRVNLSAPPASPDPSPALPGILVYLMRGNTGLVKLRGNSASSYLGVILAPSGDITVSGTSDVPNGEVTFHTQLIGQNVDVRGTAKINIKYNGSSLYTLPPKLDLIR